MLIIKLKDGTTRGVDMQSGTAKMAIRMGLVAEEDALDETRIVELDVAQVVDRQVRIQPPPPIRRYADDPLECIVCHGTHQLTEQTFSGLDGPGGQVWSQRDAREEAEEGIEWEIHFPDAFCFLLGKHLICRACLDHALATGELQQTEEPEES